MTDPTELKLRIPTDIRRSAEALVPPGGNIDNIFRLALTLGLSAVSQLEQAGEGASLVVMNSSGEPSTIFDSTDPDSLNIV